MFNVGRVFVLNNPPAWPSGSFSSYRRLTEIALSQSSAGRSTSVGVRLQ